ncbi:kinase-like domain-containing protein [Flagelloscypha sp. PMI_526]|nr:kinase-like domain-containing protein [Flagelloscypha sp. PMI_526]
MFSAPAVDLAFHSETEHDDWPKSTTGGWSYGYGVTSIGRGFSWQENDDAISDDEPNPLPPLRMTGSFIDPSPKSEMTSFIEPTTILRPTINTLAIPSTAPTPAPHQPQPRPVSSHQPKFTAEPFTFSPVTSRSSSPVKSRPVSTGSARPPFIRSPSTPRPRRRSSQQRVSLIAGRVSIAPIEPTSPIIPPLTRADSQRSYLSSAASVRPPSPRNSDEAFSPAGRDISAFEIECDIGRGAYGLVKRAREKLPDGKLGPPLVIKQIIKSRILADCWKKHPKHGTIPIEIYVLSAISNTSFTLPPRRPWSPARPNPASDISFSDTWLEGAVVKGHPNVCPMIEFFEDSHYYYLVQPSITAEPPEDKEPSPSDLFDLVEAYPSGLSPWDIRTYLGQIADALCFLHEKGIVHRDVKDENVVLGTNGTCILIDFGSSGLVKKGGWDTFSGTLDYAGPEILRGERYDGKPQDVWAFGVVAYVMLVGECPFTSPAEAQEGLTSPFASASIALDERCGEGKEFEGEEADGGGALGDGAALVRACLQVDVEKRPTFSKILECRFLSGGSGWGMRD